MRPVLSAVLLWIAASAMPAFADPIVIEPDDFAEGEQITSPYASIVQYHGWVPYPVMAVAGSPRNDWGVSYGAPTGELNFPAVNLAFIGFDNPYVPIEGLVFHFNEPVSSVQIWGLNFFYGGNSGGLSLDCLLWLQGHSSPTGCMGDVDYKTQVGDAHLYTLSAGGHPFDSIGFGGYTAINAFIFDRLEATRVPEPAMLSMLPLLLLPLAIRRRGRVRRPVNA
jgi:hypothetical protein